MYAPTNHHDHNDSDFYEPESVAEGYSAPYPGSSHRSPATSADFSADHMEFNYGEDDDVGDDLSSKQSSKKDQEGVVHRSHTGEHREDLGEDPVPISLAVYIFVGCAALNSANLGYDIGVNTAAAKKLQEGMDLSDVRLELFMGSLNLFAMVGALCSHIISDKLGRRGAFMVASFSFIIGIFTMSLAGGYYVLMIGRVFVGLGVGFGLAVDPMYISEISPAAHRGQLVTWSEIAINIGIVLGFSSGLIFYNLPDEQAWRYMFGMGAIMPTVMIFLAWFVMPESPRWLVQHGRDEDAIKVLERVYPQGYDVETITAAIKESIERETQAEHGMGWDIILFPTPAVRRMLIIGIGIAVAQQAIGIEAIQYFLIFIIDESGIKSKAGQSAVIISLGLIKLVVVFLAGHLFDQKGRRPLFFISLGGCTIALLILSFNFYGAHHSPGFTIFALALYLSFFSIGMGPGAWLISAEVFPTTIRSKAMSVATFLNRVTAMLMSSTFLSVANAISWAAFFLLLSSVCISAMLFIWAFLPETKGRSLEDMIVYFAEITGDESVLELEESARAVQREEIQLDRGLVEDDNIVDATGTMA